MIGLQFDPLVPVWAVALILGLSVLVAGFARWFGLRGWFWRGLAGMVAACALAGPQLERGTTSALSDIVVMLEDRSASQTLPGRADQTGAAARALTDQIAALPDTELRRVTVGDDPEGTLLATALQKAVAAEPAGRLAGVVSITDGQINDADALPDDLTVPHHVLLTGRPQDWDRRLVIEQAPAFGLIDEVVRIRLRVEDIGAVPQSVQSGSVTLHLSIEGAAPQALAVPMNQTLELPLTLDRPGQNSVQFSFETPGEGELTTANNSAALTINAIRDRLRVLLVSGEPHAGERTWRNLLKSDPAVDLIHFTILRPPEKSDGVPLDELALIGFPTRELFLDRIEDFDLIVFDRYRVRGILLPEYLENVVQYVKNGGAVLVAAGPEMAGVDSLNLSPLGQILPAAPTGRVIDRPFLPEVTEAGQRHPVTADLQASDDSNAAAWGRWLRMVEAQPSPDADVVMTGADDQPLLVLDRVGEGRVALLASDQVWLWGRGFEGGGPQLELLRRIAHWSMKEPELEEETLEAEVTGGLGVKIIRRTMEDQAGPIEITSPDGETRVIELTKAGPGRFEADWSAPAPGMYQLRGDDLAQVVILGPSAPQEFKEPLASAEMLTALTEASGGAVVHLSDGVPDVRLVAEGRRAHGQGVRRDWIAFTPRNAEITTQLTRRPLLPGWLWLAAIAGLALIGWLVEGRSAARSADREAV